MDITIRLRNKLNGQVEEVALPTSLEAVKERFKLDETDDYDNLVIVDSSVEFIGENDLLDDVLDFSRLVEDVDEHLVYACHELLDYDVKDFLFYVDDFDDMTLISESSQSRWFAFPLYFGKLIEIGFSGDFNDIVEVVEVDGTNRFGTGYYTVEELEALNQIAEVYNDSRY